MTTPEPPERTTPSPYLVPFDGSFRTQNALTAPPEGSPKKSICREHLQVAVSEIDELQRMLYAHNHYSILLVFQAMDAAGKDSTIRAVMTGVNPAGCQVFSFKQPSDEELDHDFLWRTSLTLPERGRIGIFNRSHYEEVLAVRVQPEYLASQKIPDRVPLEHFWHQRLESIQNYERHLAYNGTVILKFWLNVSYEEQARRFLKRIEEPAKNWKFSSSDVHVRKHWKSYMLAYQEALNATSKPWAPWYAIPADKKPFMRLSVATILRDTLKQLNLQYPKIGTTRRLELEKIGHLLKDELASLID